MKKMRPQKQLLQFVMLSLLSVVSVLVMSGESFAAFDCTSCHGTSGVSIRPIDSPTGTRDIATGAFKGSHEKHLVAVPANQTACNVCHNNTGYINSHRDGQISIAAGVGYGKPLFFNQTSVPTLSTCSTAACHNPFTTGSPKVTPTWGTASDCNSCHDATPTLGAHTKHLAITDVAVTCATCHTSPGAAGHVDGNISVSQGYPVTVAKHAAGTYTQTCTTAACHNTGRSPIVAPVWSVVNPACTTCHALQPATGSHTKHVANPTGSSASFACGVCHAGAVQGSDGGTHHLDTLINFSAGKAVSKAKGSAFTTCNTTYCHSTVQPNGGVGAPVYKTVTWGGSAGCGSCHSFSPNTGSHQTHFSAGDSDCALCHTNSGNDVTHANGVIDITTGYSQAGTPGNGYGFCSTASCHSTGRGTTTSPVWGATAAACTACHALIPATGSHDKHVTSTSYAKVSCGQCHNGAIQGSNAGTAHIDGNIDTIAALGYPQNKAKNTAFATCATTYCHSNVQGANGTGAITYKPVTWGDTSTGCDFCHAASPTSGSHTKHIAKDATCTNCHSAAASATHVDGSVNVGGAKVLATDYSGTPAPGNAYGSCSTSACHSLNGRLPAVAITWGTTAPTVNCTSCHGFPPATVYHNGITTNCNGCHPDTSGGDVNTTTITNSVQHVNGIVEGGQCDSCHGYPPVQTMAGKGTNANYSSAKLENYSGGGGVHSVAGHLALTIKSSNGGTFAGCVNCHPNTAHNGSPPGTFLVAQVQVQVPNSLRFNNTVPVTYDRTAGPKSTGTCTNVSCHFQKTPVWSTEPFTQGH